MKTRQQSEGGIHSAEEEYDERTEVDNGSSLLDERQLALLNCAREIEKLSIELGNIKDAILLQAFKHLAKGVD